MDSKLKSFAISLLRRGTFRWKPRNAVLKQARVERGRYICNICKLIHRAKDVVVDHTYCVVDPVLGWQGFDIYIERMFCDESQLQVICSDCHDKKSSEENNIRKLIRQANKPPKTKKKK